MNEILKCLQLKRRTELEDQLILEPTSLQDSAGVQLYITFDMRDLSTLEQCITELFSNSDSLLARVKANPSTVIPFLFKQVYKSNSLYDILCDYYDGDTGLLSTFGFNAAANKLLQERMSKADEHAPETIVNVDTEPAVVEEIEEVTDTYLPKTEEELAQVEKLSEEPVEAEKLEESTEERPAQEEFAVAEDSPEKELPVAEEFSEEEPVLKKKVEEEPLAAEEEPPVEEEPLEEHVVVEEPLEEHVVAEEYVRIEEPVVVEEPAFVTAENPKELEQETLATVEEREMPEKRHDDTDFTEDECNQVLARLGSALQYAEARNLIIESYKEGALNKLLSDTLKLLITPILKGGDF